MESSDLNDLNDLLVFGERLKLLARLQAAYLEELRGEGFDDEQAFQLVRDWSNRGFDWTVRWVPPSPTLEDELAEVEHGMQDLPEPVLPPGLHAVDPTAPYLLPFDEQGLDEAA